MVFTQKCLTHNSGNRTVATCPKPVGASRVKGCVPGVKPPLCLSPEPLARDEFGGAWGVPFCTGFRVAVGEPGIVKGAAVAPLACSPGGTGTKIILRAADTTPDAVNVGLRCAQPNLRVLAVKLRQSMPPTLCGARLPYGERRSKWCSPGVKTAPEPFDVSKRRIAGAWRMPFWPGFRGPSGRAGSRGGGGTPPGPSAGRNRRQNHHPRSGFHARQHNKATR